MDKLKEFYSKHYSVSLDGHNITDNTDLDHIIIDTESIPKRSQQDHLDYIEKEIKASFIDRDIHEEIFQSRNIKECLNSIKIIDKVIKTSGKKTIATIWAVW